MLYHALIASTLIATSTCAPYYPRDIRRTTTPSRRWSSSSSSSATSSSSSSSSGTAQALYFMDDSQTANSLWAIKINDDGTLAQGTNYSTGGVGSFKLDVSLPGTPNSSVLPGEIRDPLSSSFSVLTAQDYVWVCNAGDNTISMFSINPEDPIQLSLVNSPVSSGGDFPNTLTYSSKLSTLCAANTGTNAGIQCFTVDSSTGLTPTGSFIAYNLNQTNPPINPVLTSRTANLTADTAPLFTSLNFNADQTAMLATITAGGANYSYPGYTAVFPIVNGVISSQPTYSHIAGTTANFVSFQLLDTDNTFFILDEINGSYIGTVDPSTNVLTPISSSPVSGSSATCWAVQSASSGSIYLADAAVNRITEVSPTTGSVIANYNVTSSALGNANTGNLDIGAYGSMVYALSPGSMSTNTSLSIVVLDVSAGVGKANYVQNFVPRGLGLDASGQGMQIYVKGS
ncbi:hypothetical protein MMC25_000572 [Agyrium rufum]|nr:hypothetical protein [Agyrium rufum]